MSGSKTTLAAIIEKIDFTEYEDGSAALWYHPDPGRSTRLTVAWKPNYGGYPDTKDNIYQGVKDIITLIKALRERGGGCLTKQ